MTRNTDPARTARHGESGLTLLELLVVVTILVVLAVAIGTVALNYLGRAKADAAALQMEQVESGLDLFLVDMGRYPTQSEGLGALVEDPGGVADWRGPYLRKEEALVDPWGTRFAYEMPGRDDAPYALLSYGSDGVEGGEDDAADIRSDR